MCRWAPSPMRISCSARMWPGRRVTTSNWERSDVMLAEVIRNLPGGRQGGRGAEVRGAAEEGRRGKETWAGDPG